LNLFESVCNVDFTQTDYTPTYANQSNIVFYLTPESFWGREGVLGMFEVPDGVYTSNYGYFNYEHPTWNNVNSGSFGFITIIHELGHGLGLAHPHDGGSQASGTTFPGVTGPSDVGLYELNQGIWTTMSYVDGWNAFPSNTRDYGYQSTPMAFDIAALQAIYGANTSYRTGADTYYLPTTNTIGTGWSCIWDAGGTDTISNAGSFIDSSIILEAAPLVGEYGGGFVSKNTGIIGGFTIANGVVIENVIGGAGVDFVVGNNANNQLQGGNGNDILDGGTGLDTSDYSDKTTAVSVILNGSSDVSVYVNGSIEDTIKNIENITGGSGADLLVGDALANTLLGNSGNDTLKGALGKDILDGGIGVDTADYSDKTTAVKVTLNGSSNVSVYVNGSIEDTIKNIENITGGSGADLLVGDALANTLLGNSGNDTLKGGLGKDVFYGGLGADSFVFDTALSTSNTDTIKDFQRGIDKLVLDDDIFKVFTSKTTVSTGNFIVGTKALQSDDYLIYNTQNDMLYYDADGSGSKYGMVEVAKIELSGSSAPTYTDFVVVA
jgi:Ca2+-binding RTX toxin-like protein